MAPKSYRWTILDSWAWAITEEREADHWMKTLRQQHNGQSGVQVRKFYRSVRAGGTSVNLIVTVARRPQPIERLDIVTGGCGCTWEVPAGSDRRVRYDSARCQQVAPCEIHGDQTTWSMKHVVRDIQPAGMS